MDNIRKAERLVKRAGRMLVAATEEFYYDKSKKTVYTDDTGKFFDNEQDVQQFIKIVFDSSSIKPITEEAATGLIEDNDYEEIYLDEYIDDFDNEKVKSYFIVKILREIWSDLSSLKIEGDAISKDDASDLIQNALFNRQMIHYELHEMAGIFSTEFDMSKQDAVTFIRIIRPYMKKLNVTS